MIKIEVNYDIIIKAEDVISLENEISGVYVLLGQEDQPLYVGQTGDFKKRITSHLEGSTNTKDYHEKVKKVALIYEDDKRIRILAESYLISTLSSLKNSTDFVKNRIEFGEKLYPNNNKIFGRCKTIRDTGERCKRYAHANGFCKRHGGDGVTAASIQAKAIEDYLKEEENE